VARKLIKDSQKLIRTKDENSLRAVARANVMNLEHENTTIEK
jgi:hypothetical protein